MSDAYREYMAKDALAGLPTVDHILTNYVTALGGERAIRAVNGRVIHVQIQMAGHVRGVLPPINAQMQLYSRAPKSVGDDASCE